MNKSTLIGNLVADPTLKQTASGIAVCNFTIAVNRRFTNAQGEREADFIPIVVWRQQAENAAKYLRKGSKVGVAGAIQTRTYEAQDGSKRYITEVVADEIEYIANFGDGGKQQARQDAPQGFEVIEDSDLPF